MQGLAAAYFAHAVTLGQADREPLSDYWQKSLDIYKALMARGSREPNLERDYSRSLTFYAARVSKAGRLREALELLRQSHAINEKRLAAKPDDREAATDLTMSSGEMADVLNGLGRPEEALGCYRNALAMTRHLSDASPQDVYLRDRLAARHFALGDQLMKMQRDGEALRSFREAIVSEEALAARRPAVSFSRSTLARAWLSAGRIELKSGRRVAACEAFGRAVAAFEQWGSEGTLRKADRELGEQVAKSAASCASGRN